MFFLIQLIDLYTIVIFAAVILSWVQLSPANPIAQIVYALTEPVLEPARRLIPPIGGLDLSPMVVLFALQMIKSILIGSI